MNTAPVQSIHLTSAHRPFDTRIFEKECRTLQEAGLSVTLIVPHERDEIRQGVRIKAVALPGNGRERLTSTTHRVYRSALEESKEAIYHFHDPELLPWMFVLKFRGRRVIYDVHEDTPRQVMYQHWIPRWLRPAASLWITILERLAGMWFDGILAVNEVIASHFPSKKTEIVPNYPMLRAFTADDAPAYRHRDAVVAYVGGITEVRGIKEMIEAIDRVEERYGARLLLAGSFYPPRLESDMKATSGWRRVIFKGWQPHQAVPGLLATSRIGIVALHPEKQYVDSFPTKLFEYMAAGLPVIVSDFPGLRRFVETHRCGLLVDPLWPEAIAEAITYLLAHPDEAEAMGRRGLQAVRASYNWEAEGRKLIALYRDVNRDVN